MKLVIMGMQGSGKGTQAKLIEKELGIKHISTGDILRIEAKKETGLGKQIASLINSGNMVPDDMIYSMIKDHLQDNFILDGFPRTLKQAEMLDRNFKIDKAIYLMISDDEAMRRMAGRKQCRSCRTIYGVDSEIRGSKCEKCEGELFVREDDKPAAIMRRIQLYKIETEPLLEHYREKGIFEAVDGERPVEIIFEDIRKLLKFEE